MIDYADLEWFIMFPFLCGVMMWFSIDLALLIRIAGGRVRRKRAREAIERMVLEAPTTMVHAAHTPHRPTTPAAAAGTRSGSSPDHRSSHHRLDPESTFAPSPSGEAVLPAMKRYKKVVDISATTRIATKAVLRRAVVVVGGDLARSPRMQYHATSLAQSGLFDEVVLVGLDCGNQLSEALRRSGTPDPDVFELADPLDEREVQQLVWERFRRPYDRRRVPRTGCLISDRYLVPPPTPPEWFQVVFPIRVLHWVACTLYRAIAFTLLFSWLVARATAIRVNAHGQLLLTDLVMVQTPPAVPFVLLIKYLVRPVSFLYSGLVYYGLLVPASWFNDRALREIREQSRPQADPVFATYPPPPILNASPAPPSLGGSSNEGTESDGGVAVGSARPCAGASSTLWKTVSLPHGARGWRLWEWWQCGYVRSSVFWPALVVDWHNFGYTILRAAGRPGVISESYRLLEMHLCAGDVNLTVSHAMRRYLTDHRIVPSELAYMGRVAAAATAARTNGSRRRRSGGHGRPRQLRRGSGRGTVVEVLHDTAPSFFGPRSRRAFIEEVVLPMDRAAAAEERDAAARAVVAAGEEDDLQALPVAGSPTRRVGVAAGWSTWRSDRGWGISPPPAWVLAEVQDARSPGVGPAVADGALMHSALMGGGGKRGLMVVGSTSWTDDDDYTILIEALQRLDHRLRHARKYLPSGGGGTARTPATSAGLPGPVNGSESAVSAGRRSSARALPSLLPLLEPSTSTSALLDVWVLITGKGPARERFELAVRSANLSPHVVVSTLYLQSYQQYSTTLGAADVGLCLHFSSSGLDLPMKGVDMIGSGLPILAYAYPAMEELVGGRLAAVTSPTRAVSGGLGSSGMSGSGGGHGGTSAGPVECQYGWVFSTAAELERLLSGFVGLDSSSSSGAGGGDRVSGRSASGSPYPAPVAGLSSGPAVGDGVVATTAAAAAAGVGVSVLFSTESAGAGAVPAMAGPLATLAAAHQRVRSMRRTTWEENWSAVVKPILDAIV